MSLAAIWSSTEKAEVEVEVEEVVEVSVSAELTSVTAEVLENGSEVL